MLRHVTDDKGKIVSTEEAEPVCGVDFCDSCGDCLVCQEVRFCRERTDGHRWVRYQNAGESS